MNGKVITQEQICGLKKFDQETYTSPITSKRTGRFVKFDDLRALYDNAPSVGGDSYVDNDGYPLKAKIWFRKSTNEWVLEIDGVINDCSFTCRHTEPATTKPEYVAGLPSLYTTPQPDWKAYCDQIIADGEKQIQAHKERVAELEAKLQKELNDARTCPVCGVETATVEWISERMEMEAKLTKLIELSKKVEYEYDYTQDDQMTEAVTSMLEFIQTIDQAMKG